ncbi:site-specific integrase [Neisseria yangbaofengii]|nr:site-specific integrase [Neisseria yangbaofengii]
MRQLLELRGYYLHHLSREFIMAVVAVRPCSNSTKNRYLALIRAILNKAVKEWEWLAKAPYLKLYRKSKRRIRQLTKQEAAKLIAALPPNMADMVVFSLATGLRQRNVLDLEWSQVDLSARTAWIHASDSKSDRAIGVALNDTAVAVLSKQMGKHSRFVFTQQNGRKVLSISSQIWENALVKAEITDFRRHDLRHTWAGWLIQADVPPAALQETGGRESVEMVRRYVHLSSTAFTKSRGFIGLR